VECSRPYPVHSTPTLQGIFGQARGTIDFRNIMDEGKVLIVNPSKGRVGEDAAAAHQKLEITFREMGQQISSLERPKRPQACPESLAN
jgi:hypothetical protein